jgi:RNA polymerase sigma-70 factor, ECF subfamily
VSETNLTAAGFGELYQRHGQDVYRFALYLCGDPALAEDLTAEAFLRIWTAVAPVRLPSVKAYLLAVARNLYLHELRRMERQRELDGTLAASGSMPKDAESRDELRQVMAELQQLPETDRAALLLRAEEGLSYEEIAGVLGISLNAAKVKVHRARLRLAQRMNRSPLKP